MTVENVMDGWPERVHVFVLGPAGEDDAAFVHTYGLPGDGDVFFLRDGVLDLAALDEAVARVLVVRDAPVLLLASVPACALLLEAVGDADFRLPQGSRVLLCGDLESAPQMPEAMRRDLARVLHVPESNIFELLDP